MQILIYDGVCPKPYDYQTLENEGLGGTEATVLRVARALARFGHEITLAQHAREGTLITTYGTFIGPSELFSFRAWDAIIVLRDYHSLRKAQGYFMRAKQFVFWMHDLYSHVSSSDEYYAMAHPTTTCVCVSDYHKTQVQEVLKAYQQPVPFPKVRRIYNPIDDDLKPSNFYVSEQMCFFSSPHKGLDNVLRLFEMLRNHNSNFQLVIANPGYFPSVDTPMKGVVNLGSLPHRKIIEYVGNSLCVFYPNVTFPETFGLVFAEANAVGTPVVAHTMGAAEEVLQPGQAMDCREDEGVIRRVLDYHSGNRPALGRREFFNLDTVATHWDNLLKGNTQ